MMFLRKYAVLCISLFTFLLVEINKKTHAATYTVGATGNYTTIAAAYAACNTASSHIIEIQSDYSVEALPITFANQATRGTNTLTIRPKTGVSGLTINNGTPAQVFYFNGGSYIIIDGRPGGSGSGDLTLINSSTSASKRVLEYAGSANHNTVQYCTMRGSNQNTTISTAGIIFFGSTNNDDNTIDNCTIYDAAAGRPVYTIISAGAANPNENNGCTVSNCSIYNFTQTAIEINSNSYSWTISGNSFYQSSSITLSVNMRVIDISAGYGYSITGNFIGGQAASCGGSAFTLSNAAYTLSCIYIGSSVTATSANTVYSNTIQNITITSTNATAGLPKFAGIETYATAVTVGAAGNGNTIGKTTGTASIQVIDNAVNIAALSFAGIHFGSSGSGTESCAYNTFGAIAVSGSNVSSGAGTYIINNDKSGGSLTVDNNTIGNTTANNIASSPAKCQMITSIDATATSGYTVTNNTIRNINSTNASVGFYGFYIANNTATCSNNFLGNTTSNNINIAANTINYGIYFSGTGTLTASTNTLQQINLTGTTTQQFYGIYITGSGVATLTNDSILNITSASSLSGDASSDDYNLVGIFINSSGATHSILKCAMQNEVLTNTTAESFVYGIYIYTGAGTINKCHISGFKNPSTSGSGTRNFGIYIHSTVTGTWNVWNNVVIIDNGGSTSSPWIAGLQDYGDGTTNMYHNSVKVYGSAVVTSSASRALGVDKSSGTLVVKNNVFQNIRSGGPAHYAVRLLTKPTTWTQDYNYLETTGTNFCYTTASGEITTVASWRTASGASANETGNVTTTITMDNGNAYSSNAQISGNGTNLSATVTDDKDGRSRAAASNRGAWEMYPLPIELLYFDATYNPYKEEVVLDWITATEINNDYFTVERSMDAVKFEPILKISGAGYSNALLTYSASDTLLPAGKILYYRLKQTDYDGKFEYSRITPVYIEKAPAGKLSMNMHPNLVSSLSEVFIQLMGPPGTHVSFVLKDIKGKEHFFKTLFLENGNYLLSFDQAVPRLSSGIYFAIVSNENQLIQRKIVIQ